MTLLYHQNLCMIVPNEQKQVNSPWADYFEVAKLPFFSPGMLPVIHPHVFLHNDEVLKKRKCNHGKLRYFSSHSLLSVSIHLVNKYLSTYPALGIVLGSNETVLKELIVRGGLRDRACTRDVHE